MGHYEGVDERILEEIVDEEISIGDYVLTGGELAAMVLTDSVARLCDGVLSSSECFEEESHYNGLLEYPQYTRPESWRDRPVRKYCCQDIMLIFKKWRREQEIKRTLEKRPDLLMQANLTKADQKYLKQLQNVKRKLNRINSETIHEVVENIIYDMHKNRAKNCSVVRITQKNNVSGDFLFQMLLT